MATLGMSLYCHSKSIALENDLSLSHTWGQGAGGCPGFKCWAARALWLEEEQEEDVSS